LQLFEFYLKFENGRGGREMMHNGRCLSYVTWSPSRWSTLDQAAINNGSQPTPITTDAGSKHPTIDSKTMTIA